METRAVAVKNSCPLCIVDVDRARWVDMAGVLGEIKPCDSCWVKMNARSARETIKELSQAFVVWSCVDRRIKDGHRYVKMLDAMSEG